MTSETFSGFKTKKLKQEITKSFAPPIDNDGAAVVMESPNINASAINAGGFFSSFLDLEGSARTEADLISRYREIAAYPECDMAIEDITNEAISDLENEKLVDLDLSKLETTSEYLKEKIHEEFDAIIKLLNFENIGHNTFKRWYIDGRIYYHKMVEKGKESEGLKELRYLDPRKMKKIVEVIKEGNQNSVNTYTKSKSFFIYTNSELAKGNLFSYQGNATTKGVKIPTEEIAYCTSGEIDYDQNIVMSFLHKAIKIVNQVRMMEDAMVIYRLSRAPERRIFYVDTGNMPKAQAEAHVKNLMTMYRNKTVYDASTGLIRDDRKFAAVIEDFWIPRQNGSNATQIDTLPSGTALGVTADLEYFQKNLYRALNVPVSRMSPEQNVVTFGRQAEVNRDELKFSKFIQRLRNKFSELFLDLLKTQLILKNIYTIEDWEEIADEIKFVFSQDSYYAEAKETEILRNRLEMLQEIQPYVGIYFDRAYVYKKVLRLTDEEIVSLEKGIESDIDAGYFGGMPELMAQAKGLLPKPEEGDAKPALKPNKKSNKAKIDKLAQEEE